MFASEPELPADALSGACRACTALRWSECEMQEVFGKVKFVTVRY